MAQATRDDAGETTLTLSFSEVEVVMAILARVGGNPDTTPRRYADSVYEALFDSGSRYWNTQTSALLSKGAAIYFGDYPHLTY